MRTFIFLFLKLAVIAALILIPITLAIIDKPVNLLLGVITLPLAYILFALDDLIGG